MKNYSSLVAGLLILLLAVPVLAVDKNALKDHPSPYLAMHGNDPVHWQDWDPAIFKRARKDNKLVFVSIGYFSCHWCHVMQRESYQNKTIATILNRDFIPVKIDRELQPALDARLIEFVERTRGYAGWPLNVFITPDGYPLLGVVYLPPTDFEGLLVNLNQAWLEDAQGMSSMAVSAATSLNKQSKSAGPVLDKQRVISYQRAFVADALKNADHFQGGFGDPNKFPLYPQMNVLLHSYASANKKDPALKEFIRLTLDKMASQGLYDHLRGGFYRYVVDPGWLVPHFEKMLYDNAQLAVLYLDAARIFDSRLYENVAYETLDFMLSELQTPQGGLTSSLSAIDDKQVEGGYYLWDKQELKQLLSREEFELISQHWGMTGAPTLEDGHHPHIAMTKSELAKQFKQDIKAVSKNIDSAKMKMKQHQKNRVLPKDNKLLASWNGLSLFALTRAGQQNKRYSLAADRLREFIVKNLWDGKKLKRALANGKYIGNATLEDYAYVALGLLEDYRVNPAEEKKVLLHKIILQAWKRFYNQEGWLLAEDMLPGISAREAIIADGPMPSPSAVLIGVTRHYALMFADQKLLKQALVALNRGHEILTTDNFWYATHIDGMHQALNAKP